MKFAITILFLLSTSYVIYGGVIKTTVPKCFDMTCPEGTVTCKKISNSIEDNTKLLTKTLCIDADGIKLQESVTHEANEGRGQIHISSTRTIYKAYNTNDGTKIHNENVEIFDTP